MTTMATDLISLLGKNSADPEVQQAISRNGLSDVYDDPPMWRYVSSRSKGICLLFEDERMIDVQIYVQPTKLYSAFADTLPLGIRSGMERKQVHDVMGEPASSDAITNHFYLEDQNRRVTIRYDGQGVLSYLSVGFLVE